MAGLSAVATLDLWEAAERLPPVERSLMLAAAAGPPAAAEELALLPLGCRDARLLGLGPAPALEATAACPACGEQTEFSLDVGELLAREPQPPEPFEVDGVAVVWRPPDSKMSRPPLRRPTPRPPSGCCSLAAWSRRTGRTARWTELSCRPPCATRSRGR